MIRRPRVLFAYAHPREGMALSAAAAGESTATSAMTALETGIGKAAAAASLARALALRPVELVCAVGTCGVYPARLGSSHGGLAVLDAVVVGEAVFGDEGVLGASGFRDLRQLGVDDTDCYVADPGHSEALASSLGIPKVRAATVSTCSAEDGFAAALAARTEAQVETMESAAVGLACAAAGVPWVEIRVVSNETGSGARGSWRFDEAADRAQELALSALRSGVFDSAGP